jgi:hypothetical protein
MHIVIVNAAAELGITYHHSHLWIYEFIYYNVDDSGLIIMWGKLVWNYWENISFRVVGK